MPYELRKKSYLNFQNYSHATSSSNINGVNNKIKFAVPPNFLNEDFPELSASLTVPTKLCKQSFEPSVDSAKSSYSDTLQARNKPSKENYIKSSSYKNDEQIQRKCNFQNAPTFNNYRKTVINNAHSNRFSESCKNENHKQEENAFVPISNVRKVSERDYTKIYDQNSYQKLPIEGHQTVKVSDKATETENLVKKYTRPRDNYRRQGFHKKNIDKLHATSTPSCSGTNAKSVFACGKSQEKSFNSYNTYHKSNTDRIKYRSKAIEHRENITNASKNINANHVKRQSGSLNRSSNISFENTPIAEQKSEGKKKKTKKRPCKIKRQTAFQTGKLLILTPDLHSRITQNLAEYAPNSSNNTIVDISNLDEYPTLSPQTNETSKYYSKKNLFPSSTFSREKNIKENRYSAVSCESNDTECFGNKDVATDLLEQDYSFVNSTHTEVNRTRGQSKKVKGKKSLNAEKSELSEETKSYQRQPVQLLDLLSASKSKTKSRKKTETSPRSHIAKPSNFKSVSRSHNALDSSAPNIKRGKEREKPKQKKLSPLKKIILLERLRKKELRDLRKKECLLAMYSPITDDSSVLNGKDGFKASSESNSEIDRESCDVVNDISEFNDLIQKCKSPLENIELKVKKDEPEVMNKCQFSESNDSVEDGQNTIVQTLIHCKGFREYCNHLLSKKLNEETILLIDCLARFQDRQHQKDPVKARMKRRLTYGIKEVTKNLKLKKLKCIIIAPDLEDIKATGGLNSALAIILQFTTDFHIPTIFAASRKQLGKACHKSVPVSCLGIFSFEGSEQIYKKVIEIHAECLKDYQYLKKSIINNLTSQDIEEFTLASQNGNNAVARYKLMKEILSREIADSELLEKYSSDVFSWFRENYLLKLTDIL